MTPIGGPAGLPQIQALLERIIALSVGFAFLVLTVMLIMAGYKYLTGGGDAKSIGSAQQTITWALLGILFLALGWLILLLIQSFTGVHITTFCIGFPGAQTIGSCAGK